MHRVVVGALLAFTLYYALLFVAAVVMRIGYPFELEWMEGEILQHVSRLVDGTPIYVAPSIYFVPYLYTPLYYLLAAALGAFAGLDFSLLRAISVAATIGSAAVIFRIVLRATSDRWMACIAVGLFVASYGVVGGWFDVGRMDMLMLFFALLAVDRLISHSLRSAVLAGVLAGLAYWTKQSSTLIFAPVVIWLLVADRRRAARFVAGAVAVIALGLLVLPKMTGDWMIFYTFSLPATHHPKFGVLPAVAVHFFALAVGPMLVLSGLYLRRSFFQQHGLLISFAIGSIISSIVLQMNPGGWNNVLIPAYTALAIIAAIAAKRWSDTHEPSVGIVGYILLLAQMFLFLYDPRTFVPRPESEQALSAGVEVIRRIPGEVWLLSSPYLGQRAGHRYYAGSVGIEDVLHGPAVGRDVLQRSIDSALVEHRFNAIITSDDLQDTTESIELQAAGYSRVGTLVPRKAGLPVSGWTGHVVPEYIWMRR